MLKDELIWFYFCSTESMCFPVALQRRDVVGGVMLDSHGGHNIIEDH